MPTLLKASLGAAGQILFKNLVIGKDDTFLTRNVLNDDKMLCVGGNLRVTPLIWRRFTRIEPNCYTGMYNSYVDALCFKARRNVKICGFIWTKQFHEKDFKIIVRWRVTDTPGSGDVTEWQEFSSGPDKAQTEFKLHLFDF